MSSVFARIITGEIPSHKIAEDDNFLAFLDIEPLREGHVLVIPKKEVDFIFDSEDDVLSKWLVFARPVANAIKKAYPCVKVGVSVIGLEVAYAHMHLVPINTAQDLNFTQPKLAPTNDELKEVQRKITAHL